MSHLSRLLHRWSLALVHRCHSVVRGWSSSYPKVNCGGQPNAAPLLSRATPKRRVSSGSNVGTKVNL